MRRLFWIEFALVLLFFGFIACNEPVSPGGRRVYECVSHTKILFGENRYVTQAGETTSTIIDFQDALPDTLPYNSWLTVYYYGWADSLDSLDYNDPLLEMRYQYRFKREGIDIDDGSSAIREVPWYPFAPEDTRCYSNLDSTTMHVGPYTYWFMARSVDDEYNVDQCPDTVMFYGNFPPTIDSVIVGIDDPDTPELDFKPISDDTIYIGWNTYPGMNRGDTVAAYRVEVHPPDVTKYFRFYIKAGGHDHPMDPPGSGIKNWLFTVDSEEYFRYPGEEMWQFGHTLNALEQELRIKLTVPISSPNDSIVNDPPKYLGNQVLELIGADMGYREFFDESIRVTTPEFDPVDTCTVIAPGIMHSVSYIVTYHAQFDTCVKNFYIKLVY